MSYVDELQDYITNGSNTYSHDQDVPQASFYQDESTTSTLTNRDLLRPLSISDDYIIESKQNDKNDHNRHLHE